jgi:CRISPR/Cas system CSM-associated protein Csm3 (group 7 of RAMP superfamily)
MRAFEKRYLFTGQLVLKTGLHIGGGEADLSISDSPVVRTADGRPYIPGSSFKGAFRSTVEKLATTLGVSSCGLMGSQGCPGASDSREQRLFNACRRNKDWDEVTTLRHLIEGVRLRDNAQNETAASRPTDCLDPNGLLIRLCDTCRLFGSPYIASKISFSDLYLPDESDAMIQIRDGVAIDRDSERAVDGLLYNYEVVPTTLSFNLEILLEDPTETDLRLTCLGLSEFRSGLAGIGGYRSRGLGRCTVDNLTVYTLDLSAEGITQTIRAQSSTSEVTDEHIINERAKRLRRYLLGKTLAEKMPVVSDVTAFIDSQLEALLA